MDRPVPCVTWRILLRSGNSFGAQRRIPHAHRGQNRRQLQRGIPLESFAPAHGILLATPGERHRATHGYQCPNRTKLSHRLAPLPIQTVMLVVYFIVMLNYSVPLTIPDPSPHLRCVDCAHRPERGAVQGHHRQQHSSMGCLQPRR